MPFPKLRWYLKAQIGVLLLPAGLCLFGEAVIRKGIRSYAALAAAVPQKLGAVPDAGPWFWYGTLGLVLINAGIGLMIESGLRRGYPADLPKG
jgi:hypothetical protein